MLEGAIFGYLQKKRSKAEMEKVLMEAGTLIEQKTTMKMDRSFSKQIFQ